MQTMNINNTDHMNNPFRGLQIFRFLFFIKSNALRWKMKFAVDKLH
jgi:hypothetical protein